MVTLTQAEYRERVHGGWLGQLIGGAVGAPLDGGKQTQEVTGYPEALARSPQGGPCAAPAQEGIDFQFAWLRALQGSGPKLGSQELALAWLRHLRHAHGEYPYAYANFCRDVPSPISGAFDNPFREGAGGLARSVLWGMVTPGDPERAASYAQQDASLDHAGAGVEGAMWLAAMASAAFVESEASRLIEVGLTLLLEEGRVARAVRDVARWHGEHAHWARTRDMLLRAYASEDVRDSTICAGLIALALLHGRGEFGQTLLTAANCGWSTGVACAAAGALLGITLGAGGIPADWRDAVRDEVLAGWGLVGLPSARSGAMVAEHTCEMGRLVVRSQCAGRVQVSEEPSEEASTLAPIEPSAQLRQLAMGSYVTSYRRGPLEIHIDYDGRPTVGYDVPRRLAIGLANVATRSLELQLRISAPSGFVVTTGSGAITVPESGTVSFMVTISAPQEHAQIAVVNPCTLFISVDDGSEHTVPITLLGEALWHAAGPYGDFEQAHAPEQPGILSGDAPLGEDGWQRLSVGEPAVNVLADLAGEKGTYYLGTDLFLPRKRRGRLRVACNDGTKVWLSGQEIFFQHEHRPVSPVSSDEFDVELREGWNRLVVKIAQCSARRFLSVALRDPQGQIVLEAVNTFPRPRS